MFIAIISPLLDSRFRGTACGLVSIITLAASMPVEARPDFQLSGSCGQFWDASTYEEHAGGDQDALDITIRDLQLSNDGLGEPVLAMAPGKIVKSAIEDDEYRIVVDHADGWRTHYFHNIVKPGFDLTKWGAA